MSVIGVTGHQSIPDEALHFIQKGIARALNCFDNRLVGVSSLAAGADQLFADAIVKSAGCLHVVIPCHNYEITFTDQHALLGFRRLLERADIVEILDNAGPSKEAFLKAGRRVADLSDLLVAVWDGMEAKGKGGTSDIVRYARERGIEVIIVWPPDITR